MATSRNNVVIPTTIRPVLCKVFKSTELEALVMVLEELTLDAQDAKPVVSESEDLSLVSQETKSLDTELDSE
ncbi:hypothetical protein Tco_0422378 [Tanacetum coccineum]